MIKFTREEYKEIEASRERLQAFKDKFQFYPPLPETKEPPIEVVTKGINLYVNVDKKALDLQKRIVSLEEANKEHLDKKTGAFPKKKRTYKQYT